MRRKITIETEKIAICGDMFELNWCWACAASGPMVTPAQAAILLREQEEELLRRVAQGQFHSTRTQAGALMICLKSLSSATSSDWRTQVRLGPR